jgi:hypothetical protein
MHMKSAARTPKKCFCVCLIFHKDSVAVLVDVGANGRYVTSYHFARFSFSCTTLRTIAVCVCVCDDDAFLYVSLRCVVRDVIGFTIKLRLDVCDMLSGTFSDTTRPTWHSIENKKWFLHHKLNRLLMTNRVQVKTKPKADNVHDHRKAREPNATSCSCSTFFTDRFAEENTSHGRIGYAGRILSESIGSRDEVKERKVIIMFHTCRKHRHSQTCFCSCTDCATWRLIRNSAKSMASRQL